MADKKPEAGRAPPKVPKRPAHSSADQRERFIEAAQAAGVTDEGFDKALSKVAPPKRKPK